MPGGHRRARGELSRPTPFDRERRLHVAALLALSGGAFLARLWPILVGGGLYSYILYDDGVFFGAAAAVVNGRLPYRDFFFVHPPGIALILAPFALVGQVIGDANGFALARVSFMLLGGVNTALVGILASRHGRLASVFAAGLYAFWYAARLADRTTVLIGPQTALLLLALIVLRPAPTPRRAALAGALLGLSLSVQVWQVVPIALIGIALLLRCRRDGAAWSIDWRAPAAYAAAAIATAATICAPFFIAAPHRMFEMVLLDQLQRPEMGRSLVVRLEMLEGWPARLGRDVPDAIIVLIAILVLAAVGFVVTRARDVRLWGAIFAVETAYLLITPSLYLHYAAWSAPLLMALLGTAVALGLARLRPSIPTRGFAAAVLGTALALFAPLALVSFSQREGSPIDRPAIAAALGPAQCTAADVPTLLLELDRFSADIRRGCPQPVDVTGASYHVARGKLPAGDIYGGRRGSTAFQRLLRKYLTSGDAALVMRAGTDGLTPATRFHIGREFPALAQYGRTTVLTRLPADRSRCDPSYPTLCLPSPPPRLGCGRLYYDRFPVLPPDPHRVDRNQDGTGCEH